MDRVSPESMQYYDQAVTDKMMMKYGWDRMQALKAFTGSRTYAMLLDRRNGMTQFGADGIMDIWENEQITGQPGTSIYLREESSKYEDE